MLDSNSINVIHELRKLPNTTKLGIIIVDLSGATNNTSETVQHQHLPTLSSLKHFQDALQLVLHDDKQPATLLHVEDDLDIIQLVKSILKDTDVNYHSVTSLAEARNFLNSHAVDLVVLDLVMPDGSGTTLLKELNGLYPVIIFSAHDTSELINHQVAAILTKSTTDNKKFLTTICHVLNHVRINKNRQALWS